MTENPAEKASVEKAILEEYENGECQAPLKWKAHLSFNAFDGQKYTDFDLHSFARNVLKRFSEDERRIEKERILKNLREKIEVERDSIRLEDEDTIFPLIREGQLGMIDAYNKILKILQESEKF